MALWMDEAFLFPYGARSRINSAQIPMSFRFPQAGHIGTLLCIRLLVVLPPIPCFPQFFVLRRRIFLRKDAASAIQLSEAYVMERTISCSKSPNFFPKLLKPPGSSASGLFPMRMVMGVLAEK